MSIIEFIIYYTLFMLLHELGHIAASKIFKLTINKIGFALLPVPHIYVYVEDIPGTKEKYFYYLSGPIVTVLILIILIVSELIFVQSVFIAIAVRTLLDFNPFFSDFTLMKKNFKFSRIWYALLFVWGFLIIRFVKIYIQQFGGMPKFVW